MEKLVAIVTGGTRGIGLEIARSLVKMGASVTVTYCNNDQVAQKAREELDLNLKQDQQIYFVKGDGGNPEIVEEQYCAIQKKLGQVNVLVNNAGIMQAKSFDKITVEDWNETIRINLSSAFYWSRQVVSDMKELKFGRIVNISSIAARGGGVVGPHYAASKAGLIGMTRYAAKELGQHGITVNAIAPAFIENAGIFLDWSKEQKKILEEQIHVPRLGKTDDVVRAFEYLLMSPFVTGVTLDVNGGTFMI